MQNLPSKFYLLSFQFSKFAFCHFNSLNFNYTQFNLPFTIRQTAQLTYTKQNHFTF